jgi:hypothetical protein
MIVQARRSAFTTPSGASRGGDGAELIKVGDAGDILLPNSSHTSLGTSFLSWNRLGHYPPLSGAIPPRTS